MYGFASKRRRPERYPWAASRHDGSTAPTFENCAAFMGWHRTKEEINGRAFTHGPLVGGKDRRPLENNTRMTVAYTRGDPHTGLAEPVAFAITLHDTDIVTVTRFGVYVLRMGGWNTMTTRSRINGYSPASISTDRGRPFLYWDSGRVLRCYKGYADNPDLPAWDDYLRMAQYRVPFREGMPVNRHGVPIDPADLALVEREEEYISRRGKRRRRWAKGWGSASPPAPLWEPANETAAP